MSERAARHTPHAAFRNVPLLALLALSVGCSGAEEIEETDETESAAPVERHGDSTIVFASGGEVDVGELTTQPRTVFDPYEHREVVFQGALATDVLDGQFGDAWREADEVVFECADGYRAAVPVWRLKEHRAYLAVDRRDAAFAIDKEVGGETQRVSLAPAYLIWENIEDTVVRGEGDWGWPYQIVRVELASADERYARMTPPASADESGPDEGSVARGFSTFRRHCARCHSINGQGGRVGPELNYPASVTEYWRGEWLLRFILEPASVRSGTAMPGLPRDLADRERHAQDIVAYLGAMAARKIAPEPAASAP